MAAAPRAGKAKIAKIGYDEARPAAVVLISGPEQFLADRASRSIREALRTVDASLEVHDIDASGYGHGELFTLASPSLFAEPRLIRVEGVEKASDAFLEDAKRYLAEPAEDTTLVLRHAGGQRGKGLLDAVRGDPGASIGAVEVVCAEVKKDADRLGFAQAEFRRLEAQIAPNALRALVAAYQGGLGELAGAIEQLVSNVGKRLTEQDVERATEGRVEAGAFKVADAAIAGNAQVALRTLRHALSTGTDPIPIVATLAMKVRQLAKVQGVNEPAAVLASQLGMAPWQVQQAQQQARGWKRSDLAACVETIAQTDRMVKGGGRSPGYALERAILFIAGKAPRH